MTPQGGLRERKKQRTRETIAREAHKLFVERGYHATTLPDIAEAADVSTRTIFSYFPSKEDILFSDVSLREDALAQVLAARPEGKGALETVREFMIASEQAQLRHELHLLVTKDQRLLGQLRARIALLEEVLAPAIAEDLGVPKDDAHARIVAAALTAAFNLLAERGASKERLWTPEETAAEIDPYFTFLRGGLEALKQRRRSQRG